MLFKRRALKRRALKRRALKRRALTKTADIKTGARRALKYLIVSIGTSKHPNTVENTCLSTLTSPSLCIDLRSQGCRVM